MTRCCDNCIITGYSTNTVMMILLILFLIFAGFVGMLAVRYNRLVELRNRYKNAFSQIDVQLKRRYDLIPNLVETAKGYLQHERETLDAVVRARNAASRAAEDAGKNPGDAAGVTALAGAEGVLGGAIGRLLAVVEAYPDLKANQTMSNLMEEFTTTENKVSFARQSYNDSVMGYNTAMERFPDILFAGAMGFSPAQAFEIKEPEEREAVKVSFRS